MYLSALERKILNCIQEDIPLTSEPFKILSGQLGIKEEEFLERIRQLKGKGIIRNFAAHLNHRRLGFKSTLVGLRVPASQVEVIAKKIIRYPEVTHCYLRQGEYNLWLVFICSNTKKLRRFVSQLTKQMGSENVLNLATKRQLKLKTSLVF